MPPPRPRPPASASAALPRATPPAAGRPRPSRLASAAGRRYLPPSRILPGDLNHHRGYAASRPIPPLRLYAGPLLDAGGAGFGLRARPVDRAVGVVDAERLIEISVRHHLR